MYILPVILAPHYSVLIGHEVERGQAAYRPITLQIIYLDISKNSLKNETSNDGCDLRMLHNTEKFLMSQKATVKIFSAYFGFGFP
jgi:hypothetical protein